MWASKALVVGCFLAAQMMLINAYATPVCAHVEWPLWEAFKTHFVQDSGRVLDASTPQQHSSSEGQSYGMFFALVAGDRASFDRIWTWAVNNLSNGDTSQNLPAWIWGKAEDGTWRVLDENSASDANLWFIYSLLEAGRLWNEPSYTSLAHDLLALVMEQEIAALPNLGDMLLPGKEWFVDTENQTWQLNASYLPIPILRRLSLEGPEGPWAHIADNTAIMIQATSPHGFVPDWTTYQNKQLPSSFTVDTIKGPTGSYDAIRTYLWAGMTHHEDPLYNTLLEELEGMIAAVENNPEGLPPETVNTQTGHYHGIGPFGFSAALIPYFNATKHYKLLNLQAHRVRLALQSTSDRTEVNTGQPPYYDYVLSLFGMGWLDGLFKFQADGTLALLWRGKCPTTTE